ncbi:MAG: alcohol dehydrogenase catalytic domain-containing protein [Candidatus Sulfobium sp.]
MRAVLFDGTLRFPEDYPMPLPEENEALVKVLMAGICNTDIEITRGYSGFEGVMGHEFVGVVERINDPDRGLAGKRVVGEINCGCGKCDYCLKGLKNHCVRRRVVGIVDRDGALADYMTLPIENLIEVPGNLTDEEAVFTEPLAAAFEIMEQVCIRPTDRVMVLGDGKLGLLASLVLCAFHDDISLAGRHESKLKIAGKQGVRTFLSSEGRVEKAYDIVIEATGTAEGLETALSMTKPRGVIVLKSTVAAGKVMNLFPVVVDEVTVVGSRCGPFRPALSALSQKRIDVRPLVTGIYTFDRAEEAFRKAKDRESLKVIIDFR